MNKLWIGIVAVLIVAGVVGYLGRHQLKSLMGGSTPTAMPQPTSVATPSSNAPTSNIYMTKTDTTKGAYLVDFAGMTLYTFDKDSAGTSTCYNACAKVWPAYSSGATAQGSFPANISVLTRTDGTKQFAWKGMPLYYYSGDAKVGDIMGDGIGGIWHIVKM